MSVRRNGKIYDIHGTIAGLGGISDNYSCVRYIYLDAGTRLASSFPRATQTEDSVTTKKGGLRSRKHGCAVTRVYEYKPS
jgi:hypothetical protein